MNRKVLLGFIGFLSIAIIIGGDVRVSQARRQETELYRNIELFIDALRVVQKDYVEPVEDKELIYGALKGMLMSLDPYSAFLEPEIKEELEMETKGEFQGVGMEITQKDGIITVVSPIEDTPAWNAGIKAGDMIVEIEGQSTKGFTTLEAARKLRGEKGTEVTISIMRKGLSEIKEITLVRDRIIVKSIREEVFDNMAYVRIRDFQERTPADLTTTLKRLNEQKIEGILIDLRNNPGGLLTSAISLSELFLPPGKLVVYTQGREEKGRNDYISRRRSLWDKPIVLLVNRGSASASEILVGALKDNLDNVIIAGEQTFGKGSVQNLIPLADGSALKLTIAHYYTPSGRTIEGEGILPDVEIEPSEEAGIIPGGEGDTQMQRALEILKELIENNG